MDEIKGYVILILIKYLKYLLQKKTHSANRHVFIGAKYDGTASWSSGSLIGLEIYSPHQFPLENILPEVIRNSLITNQQDMVDVVIRESTKRKRTEDEMECKKKKCI